MRQQILEAIANYHSLTLSLLITAYTQKSNQ